MEEITTLLTLACLSLNWTGTSLYIGVSASHSLLQMPKRKRAQRPAPESEEDYVDNSDSSYDETSRVKATQKARKTRKKDHENDGSTAVNSISGHSVSMHVISAVEPMRIALLEWYDKVHDARNMPWRKKFDPSLDVEGRGQRAYEVNIYF